MVTGLRLAELDEPTWKALHDTWLKYALLIFPGQFLKKDEQIAFAKRFGPLEFEMGAVSNVREDGTLRAPAEGDDVVQILKGNEGWHANSTFKPIQAKGAVFSAEVVPTIGGHTGWADMRAAYDALDAATQGEDRAARRPTIRCTTARARIGHVPKKGTEDYRRLGFEGDEDVLRPLVKVHPDTGRKSLLIGRHAHDIPGLRAGGVAAAPAGADRLRLPAAARLSPRLAGRRRRDLGQSLPAAPGDAVRHDPAARDVAHPHRRRSGQRSCHVSEAAIG